MIGAGNDQDRLAALQFLFDLHKTRGQEDEMKAVLTRIDVVAAPDASERARLAESWEQIGRQDKAVAVLERDVSVGAGGIIYTELCRSLNGARNNKPLMINYILGLGGRDVTINDIREIGLNLFKKRESDVVSNPIRWSQVRGLE